MPVEQSFSFPSDVESKTARAIDLLRSRLSNFETEHGRLMGLSYKPFEPDEVVITTSPKAGTTWLQQICHQLRVAHQFGHGDDQFDEISRVVPWLELAYDQGQDLYAPQYAGGCDTTTTTGGQQQPSSQQQQPPIQSLRPRLFKTHAWQSHCPLGFHKVIVGIRDPVDVVLSFYYFFRGWFFPSDVDDDEAHVTVNDFIRHFWMARGTPTSKMENASYFVHLISWYQAYNNNANNNCQQQQQQNGQQQDPKILFVFYEDLKDNLEEQVRRIASFLSTDEYNFTASDEVIQLVVERSSFEYMKRHEHLFDEKLSKQARNVACGFSPTAGLEASKLRLGRSSSSVVSELPTTVTTATTTTQEDHLPQEPFPWRRYHLQDELPLELQDKIQEQWRKVVYPVTGCETYADFRNHMKQLEKVQATASK